MTKSQNECVVAEIERSILPQKSLSAFEKFETEILGVGAKRSDGQALFGRDGNKSTNIFNLIEEMVGRKTGGCV